MKNYTYISNYNIVLTCSISGKETNLILASINKFTKSEVIDKCKELQDVIIKRCSISKEIVDNFKDVIELSKTLYNKMEERMKIHTPSHVYESLLDSKDTGYDYWIELHLEYRPYNTPVPKHLVSTGEWQRCNPRNWRGYHFLPTMTEQDFFDYIKRDQDIITRAYNNTKNEQ